MVVWWFCGCSDGSGVGGGHGAVMVTMVLQVVVVVLQVVAAVLKNGGSSVTGGGSGVACGSDSNSGFRRYFL